MLTPTDPRASTRRLAAGVLAIALAGLGLFGLAGCSTDQGGTDDGSVSASQPVSPDGASPDITTGAPEEGTADAAAWEALMGVDGEYNSAAQYAAVVDKFGPVEPYISILAAENHHSDMLAMHLRRAGYDVPANPYLGKVEAPADLATAAQNWADGEVRNIAMYDALKKQAADDAHLTMMFSHLRGASENAHLPMFRQAAENGGQLTQEQMAKWSPSMIMMGMEMGGMMGGQGMGGHNMNGHDMSSMSPGDGNSGHDMSSMSPGDDMSGHDMSSMSPSPAS